MPGKECDAIIDPEEKADCLAYRGDYAREVNEGGNLLGRGMNEIEFDEETILNPRRSRRGVTKTPRYK